MNSEKIFATVAIAAAVALLAPPAPAHARTGDYGLEAGARAAAAEGNEALRRYVWRTRMIHAFDLLDFVEQDSAAFDGYAADGFWPGVPGAGDEADPWIEAAGSAPQEPQTDPTRE